MIRFVVLSFACLTCVLGKVPTFDNPGTYVPDIDKTNDDYSQLYNATKPLGFSKALLPHPPNAGRPNPVIQITGLENRQLEIRVETFDKGAALCVRDNDEGPDTCSQGVINQCYTPSKSTLKWEFYCNEGCQSSDVYFHYRIIRSAEDADDLWCANRETDGYPSELIEGPAVLPLVKGTPPPRTEGGSSGKAHTIFPAVLMLTMCTLIAAWLLN